MSRYETAKKIMLFAMIFAIFVCGIAMLSSDAKEEMLILDLSSSADAQNNPANPATFTLNNYYTITRIRTYHWNYGKGAMPGNIGLRDQSGNWYGPWPAYGESEMGVTNAYWNAYPGVNLPPGTYTIKDSDPRTWSCNADTGWRGFVRVWAK
ncbi:MAG: hypothetical protein JW999_04415 [Methanotrichaceae archaeon]|nr:hypothetical protein [Methanotrichaceae archaeon]